MLVGERLARAFRHCAGGRQAGIAPLSITYSGHHIGMHHYIGQRIRSHRLVLDYVEAASAKS
jgi:hypothetical protein